MLASLLRRQRPVLATLAAVVWCVMACGCSNPSEATKGNFQKALQRYYDTLYPKCYFLTDLPRRSDTVSFGQANSLDLRALAAAGLMSETKVSEAGGQAYTYDLTEAGRKAYKPDAVTYKDGSKRGGFCAGKATVNEVTQFTQPAEGLGMTLSTVNFELSIADLPEWAKAKPLIEESSDLKEDVSATGSPRAEQATLVLAGDGWVHERELRKRR